MQVLNTIQNSASLSFSYQVSPTIIKSSSKITNIVTSQFNIASISSTKVVDKKFASMGDTLIYTINLLNIGNATANNVIISDTIPNGTTFVLGSVLINNIPTATSPNGNVLIINPGSISPNGLVSVIFTVLITTIPNPSTIQNLANTSFDYTLDPSIPNGKTGQSTSNKVSTQISSADLSGITTFVDKNFATCGETITYTINIPNIGNSTATNVVIKDSIPNGTSLVSSTIIINGQLQPIGANPQTGISLGNIPPGSISTVSYQVIVTCL